MSNPVAAAGYLDKIVKIFGDEYAKLKALTPDASVKSDYNDYVTSVGLDVAALKTGDAKSHAKDPSGLSDLRGEQIHSRDITTPEAANLGFIGCARK